MVYGEIWLKFVHKIAELKANTHIGIGSKEQTFHTEIEKLCNEKSQIRNCLRSITKSRYIRRGFYVLKIRCET